MCFDCRYDLFRDWELGYTIRKELEKSSGDWRALAPLSRRSHNLVRPHVQVSRDRASTRAGPARARSRPAPTRCPLRGRQACHIQEILFQASTNTSPRAERSFPLFFSLKRSDLQEARARLMGPWTKYGNFKPGLPFFQAREPSPWTGLAHAQVYPHAYMVRPHQRDFVMPKGQEAWCSRTSYEVRPHHLALDARFEAEGMVRPHHLNPQKFCFSFFLCVIYLD